jgi:hypothetical protein
VFDHTDRVKKLLAEGKVGEARQFHLQRVDEQLELAKSQPIGLSDLIGANEAFLLDKLDRQVGRFVQVSQDEFEAFVRRRHLVPDGFHPNGAYTQTSFLDADGKERARISSDLQETIYEIES